MIEKINVPVNPTYHEVINNFAKEWEKKKSNKYKEYRAKWLENPKNFVHEGYPLHLDIEPTNACNLKCPMCPRTVIMNDEAKNKSFNVGMMKLEDFKKIIDEAVEIGVYSIKLNWLGEPLVHPNIVEMVKYAKEKGIEDVMFNTNAAILTEEMSRKLIEAGLDKIFFSFDSPAKEKYESIRIGANFDDTLNNIKTLMKLRKDMGRTSPLTRVSMVLMEDNKDEYEKFVDLFKDIVDVVAYVEYREPMPIEKTEYNSDFACSQLWQRMFIAWDGDVIPCCVDSEKDMIMGNVHNDSIKNIWNSDKYRELREDHKLGKYHNHWRCRKCDLPNKKSDGNI